MLPQQAIRIHTAQFRSQSARVGLTSAPNAGIDGSPKIQRLNRCYVGMIGPFLVGITWLLSVHLSLAQDRASIGQLLFNNACRTCHTLRRGDDRLGPSLAGVIGRISGANERFNYSPAMRSANLVWDEDNLDRFLADPDGTLPGHNMKPYGGIASEDARRLIIEHLMAHQ